MKKALSLLLALVMVLGLLTACGGSNSSGSSGNSSSSGSSNASSSGGAGNYTLGTNADGLPIISFMLPSYFGGELEDSKEYVADVKAAYEKATGVSVNWQFTASDAYEDMLGLALMDRDNMPSVLAATGTIKGNIISSAQQGAFWDLAPFIASGDYPFLSQVPEDVYDMLTVNGQLVGIPKMRNTGRYGLSYRADWAEALGFTSVPTTPDEVYDLMYAFAHNDPDGNGIDDTYGMEAVGEYTGWMEVILTWFGCGYSWVEKDGDLVPVHETAEYKEALDWLKKCYDNGIMRSDFVTVQSSDWGQAVQRSEAGAIVDCLDSAGRRAWLSFQNNEIPSVVNPDEYASMELVGPVGGYTAAVQVYNGYFLITKDGAKTEDDVRACLKFLDAMNSIEMRALADYGIEGVTYDLVDGAIQMKPEYEGEQTALPNQGLNQAVGYIPFLLEGALTTAQTEPYAACEEAMARSAEVAVFNVAEAYLTTSSTYADVGTILAQTISDARTQYITGAIDWNGFQAAVATWEAQGGAQMKTEVNEAYHAA